MLVIVDYGVGNLNSIQNMFKKTGVSSIISSNIDDIKSGTKILLPGMGHFDNCMKRFNQSGLRQVIEKRVFDEKIPLLGICVGLQMFMESSEEGTEAGLGWIKGRTIRFVQDKMDSSLKVPNMGWNIINSTKESLLLKDLQHARFYFAHSFHVEVDNPADELANCVYGYQYTCAVERDNLYGVQFHPEKSHRYGMQLLKNFAVV